MSIRPVQQADVPSIVRIHIAAFANETSENYRYPYKDEYAEDYAEALRKRYAENVESDKHIFVVYEEVPSSGATHSPGEDPPNSNSVSSNQKGVVAGYAVWARPGTDPVPPPPETDSSSPSSSVVTPVPAQEGRHVDWARQTAFRKNLAQHKSLFFDDVYGSMQQLYLGMLAVDPACQRRGIGEALMRWGMKKARDDGLQVCSVFASLDGLRLYERVGYVEVGRFATQLEGEKERFEVPGLLWHVQ